jgi:hypothetical protein
MQTSLLRYLRERIHAVSVRRAVILTLFIVVPVIATIGMLVSDGIEIGRAIWLWFGGTVLVNVILGLVIFLVRFEDRLERQRGLTVGKIIGSSGFALIRSESNEIAKTPWRQGDFSLAHAISLRHLKRTMGRSRSERFKAALHSSGFSVIRESLPNKDPDRID